ncbi:hypothetical protein RND71_031821 [Anisodus tanguticus]|uniref:ABC transporter domain-containing protein n=1 Tax=Anisodus tanguticus TaxID=243964 RepID=A0AAE1RC13_9SOLA|nr:hypothetical protein RND71_031821 [Anisodus tanguticus]
MKTCAEEIRNFLAITLGIWNVSVTLTDLLKRVGDSTEENHHVLELGNHSNFATTPSSFPFVLSFHNLSYNVKVKSKMALHKCLRRGTKDDEFPSDNNMKVLLNDISGEAREGEIMAVLGASCSGKSTLIDALADRISRDSLKGNVTLNGEVLESKLLKVISAYVMQDDLLFPMLTVEETLMFSAEFRLPRTLSKSKKKARVQALIDQLGLRNAAKTVIGDEGHRGVSGGERRRISIGIDIIHDPIPSYRILSILDRLIILSRGHTVFTSSPSSLQQFFAEFGNPIPENENRIEFVLDFIRELEGTPNGTKNLMEFNKTWQREKTSATSRNNFYNGSKPSLKDAISVSVSRGKLASGATNIDLNLSSSNVPKFANPFWVDMVVIAKRSMFNSTRMPELFGMRFGVVVVTGIILATIFWKLDDSPKGVQERLGFFAFAMSTTFYTCAEAIPVFLQERYIFMRETAYNAYHRSSYVLSHAIISLPSILVLSLAFAVTTYWSVGLAGGESGFFFFLMFMVASFWAGSSFVTFLSGVIYNVMIAYTVVVAILAYFVLFSGYFISRDRIPPYWIWFHYMSLVKYPFQGVLQNEFSDPNKCFVKGVQIFDVSPLRVVPEPLKIKLLQNMSKVLGMNITSSTCLTIGTDILKQSGVNDLNKWTCFWMTIGLGFFFRILFYFALLIGSKNKR